MLDKHSKIPKVESFVFYLIFEFLHLAAERCVDRDDFVQNLRGDDKRQLKARVGHVSEMHFLPYLQRKQKQF